jgi:DNA invertase Pin-like site-specific DNA recombinase
MARIKKELPRWLTDQQLLNPTPDLDCDAIAYGRQSSAKQVVNNVESHKAQTIELLKQMREKLGYRDDGTTGKVTLRIENQIAKDGKILNASGAWPIDRRPHLKATLDDVENDRVKLIAVDVIDRLFRDEDQIDSNIFLKACKEHGCYIYVVATGMLYNLANEMHMMIVRQLLQIAAHYLKTLRETTTRRRRQSRDAGKYAGYGPLKLGYIRDSEKTSETYGKLLLYPPHAKQGKWIYKRIIELNFNVTELAKEVSKMEYLFEPFPNATLEGHRGAKKLPNGGFTLTRTGLRSWLTDETNIGVHYTDSGERVENNHEALIDRPTYDLICAHITPIREMPGAGQKTNRKGLLTQVLTSRVVDHPQVTIHSLLQGDFNYELVSDDLIVREFQTTVRGSIADSIVTEELFKNIKNSDIQLLKDQIAEKEKARVKRLAEIEQRLTEIETLQAAVMDGIASELAKLKKAGLDTSKYLEGLQAKYDRLCTQAEELEAEREELQQKTESLGALENELENLQELWPEISLGLKRQLINEVVQCVLITPLSPLYTAISVLWAYDNWPSKSWVIRRSHSSRPWTPDEDKILYTMYPDPSITKEQLLNALPIRSWQSIDMRIRTKKIDRTRSCNTHNPLNYTCANDVRVAEMLKVDLLKVGALEIPNEVEGTVIWEKDTSLQQVITPSPLLRTNQAQLIERVKQTMKLIRDSLSLPKAA